jgi:asparagine synthase (glutamine-hydrolysing)
MCGIAGIISSQYRADISVIRKTLDMMAHRGPDDEGFFIEGPAALIHRRLSVIDLNTGAQPVFNEDKSLLVVFNGEIYNFLQLRSILESKGHIFSTNSDTEVILHGYEEWGPACSEKFQGMFAFAVYNRNDESLFLSRDPCGEKPLYYYHQNGTFIFASEIQALAPILGHTPSPDPESLYLYLRLGYIPGPKSFFHGIKKLLPGSYLLYKKGTLSCHPYYNKNIVRSAKTEHSGFSHLQEKELCDALDAALRNAVKKMLISDVPLGAFLSGGLDSSLIVAMMAKTGMVPETFSISFGETSFDESQFALRVSRLIGTRHHSFPSEFGDMEKCLSIMKGVGEPFADSSAIPTYYLAENARKTVKTVLSGDGADELFGGYRRYPAQVIAAYYLRIPAIVRKKLFQKFLSLLPDKDVYYAQSVIKSLRIFTERSESADSVSGLMLNTVFSHDEIVSLFPDLPDSRGLIHEILEPVIQDSKLKTLMEADRCLYLPDDILVKTDRMSMRHSLEMRSPYLDSDVVKLSEQIPISMKIRGMTQKYLLKKVALRYLPPDIVFRKKHGFMIPMSQWLKKAGKESIKRRMPSQTNAKAVDDLLESHFGRGIDCSHKLFALIMLTPYLI